MSLQFTKRYLQPELFGVHSDVNRQNARSSRSSLPLFLFPFLLLLLPFLLITPISAQSITPSPSPACFDSQLPLAMLVNVNYARGATPADYWCINEVLAFNQNGENMAFGRIVAYAWTDPSSSAVGYSAPKANLVDGSIVQTTPKIGVFVGASAPWSGLQVYMTGFNSVIRVRRVSIFACAHPTDATKCAPYSTQGVIISLQDTSGPLSGTQFTCSGSCGCTWDFCTGESIAYNTPINVTNVRRWNDLGVGAMPYVSASATPTSSATGTASGTSTLSGTTTPTASVTISTTSTPSSTRTSTPTTSLSGTSSASSIPSAISTPTSSKSAASNPPPSYSATASRSASGTATATVSMSRSATSSGTATNSRTASVTNSRSAGRTISPSATNSRSVTASSTSTSTVTSTRTSSGSAKGSVTSSAISTLTPSATSTSSSTTSVSMTSTSTSSASASPSATSSASSSSSSTASTSSSASSSSSATSSASASASSSSSASTSPSSSTIVSSSSSASSSVTATASASPSPPSPFLDVKKFERSTGIVSSPMLQRVYNLQNVAIDVSGSKKSGGSLDTPEYELPSNTNNSNGSRIIQGIVRHEKEASSVFPLWTGLNTPTNIALDSDGNVFVVDCANPMPSQSSHTSEACAAADGGIAIFGNNVLYVANTLESVIRRINSISLNAWGDAFDILSENSSSSSSSSIDTRVLQNPSGIAVDTAGIVYVADTGNNAIKRIDVHTNELITIVSSDLQYPRGIVIDTRGQFLYIADTGNHTIKRVDLATYEMITLVSSGLNMPWGLAIASSEEEGEKLYIADRGNNQIQVLDLGILPLSSTTDDDDDDGSSSRRMETLVEADAGLSGPCGVAVDTSRGILYIADTGNNAIKLYDMFSGELRVFVELLIG